MAVPIRPWTTCADVHSDFLRIDRYPVRFTPQEVLTSYYVLWWMVPISTFIFVVFFAFGRDAVEEYKRCWLWFRTRILRQSVPCQSSKGSFMDKFTTG
ncbi:Pheromone B beta 1 receptor, partial [Tephrocybe sp. NHM501043]